MLHFTRIPAFIIWKVSSYVFVFLFINLLTNLFYIAWHNIIYIMHTTANQRTVHFSWSIMISFDIVQVLGSHQNVFTLKLIEGIHFYLLFFIFIIIILGRLYSLIFCYIARSLYSFILCHDILCFVGLRYYIS